MVFPTPPPSQHSIFTPVHGRNAHLFQPPKSPALVATTPAHASTSTDYFANGASRKRARPTSSYHEQPQGNDWNIPPTWTATTPHDDDVFGSGPNSMVNEQYNLAGGYDTPGLVVNTDLDHTIDQDVQARKWTRDRDATFGSSGPSLQGALARERNGVPRMADLTEGKNQVSWTRFAFSLVGKAFTFGTSVFKGFYAGGGDGYDFNEKHGYDGISSHFHDDPPTPVPGQWQSDFFGDFEQDNPISPPSSELRPPNKRRQTDKDEWGFDWHTRHQRSKSKAQDLSKLRPPSHESNSTSPAPNCFTCLVPPKPSPHLNPPPTISRLPSRKSSSIHKLGPIAGHPSHTYAHLPHDHIRALATARL